MDVEQGAHRYGEWLANARDNNRPCPTNIPQSIAAVLGCSRSQACRIRTHLSESKRLVVNPIRKIFILDGKYFDPKAVAVDEVSKIKDRLRRKFNPVYDPRTVERPDRVATGEPDVLVIGGEIVPFDQAKARAAGIPAP